MFDDLSSLENQSEGGKKPEEEEPPSRGISRWSHVIAGLIFCLLYFPFQSQPWSWPLAIAGSYSAFAFAIALGLGFDDLDDLFVDSRVPKYLATLLAPHVLILGLVVMADYSWLRFRPILPPWVTTEGRRGSLWDLCLIVLLWFAGTREGIWMAGKIKQRLNWLNNHPSDVEQTGKSVDLMSLGLEQHAPEPLQLEGTKAASIRETHPEGFP